MKRPKKHPQAERMRILVIGAGKVGWNLCRELLERGHDIHVIEQDRRRYLVVEQELEQRVSYGDATELWVLERAGIEGADMVIAVTGDDEDNLLIGQLARDRYGIDRFIARCNNPRNVQHFELLGIKPYVSATDIIMRLIEHEVPSYGLIHLLDLPEQEVEVIELLLTANSPVSGMKVADLEMPKGTLLAAVLRDRKGFVPTADTVLQVGDELLAVLEMDKEAALTEYLIGDPDV